jgi:hypothetical protein
MKKLIFILLFIVLAAQPCLGAINAFTTSVDLRKTYNNAYRWTAKPKDKLYDWAQEVEDRIEGTTANQSFYFDPTDTEPTASEGRVYYDDSENALKWYNGSAWVTAGTSAGGDSLDTAYNNGATLDVDGDAVTMTTSDEDNNVVLAIVQNEATNDNDALTITMGTGATGSAITITGQTGGTDITADNWSMALTSILTLSNGDSIDNNTTDDIFQFDSNDKEDFSIDLSGTNIIGFSSDTDAITLEFNALDRLTGIEDITFDAEAANITLTADAGTEDLTISQAGGVDASLILTSAGTSTTDATQLLSTAGTIKINSADNLDIDAADNITVDTAGGSYTLTTAGGAVGINSAGGDLTIDATDKSIKLDAGEAAADDAVVIVTTGAGSGIQITSLADIDITTTGASGEDITLDNQGGSIHLISTEAADDGFNLDTTGGVDIDATTSISLKSAEATGDAIEIVTSNAAGGIDITSGTGDVVITSTDDIQLTNATAAGDMIQLLNTAGTSITEDSAAIQLTATAGGIIIQSDANVDGDLIVLRVDGGTTNDILLHNDQGTGTDCINLVADVGGITLDGNQEASSWTLTANGAGDDLSLIQDGAADGSIVLTSAGTAANAIDINATAGGIDIDISGGAAGEDFDITTDTSVTITTSEAAVDQFKVDATGTIAQASGDAINLETTDGGVIINADGADNGDIDLDSADDMTLTVGGDMTLAITGSLKMGNALIANNRITTSVDADNDTLTEAESGSTIVYTMTGGAATVTLPEATANNIGMWFMIVDGNPTAGRDLTIDPEGAGTINGDAAGNYIKCENDRDGEAVIIFTTAADTWYAIACGSSTVWTEE